VIVYTPFLRLFRRYGLTSLQIHHKNPFSDDYTKYQDCCRDDFRFDGKLCNRSKSSELIFMADTNTHEHRTNYKHFLSIPTRWRDNDIYQHVNNVLYYEFFDTVINEYLIRFGGLDIINGETVGYAVETHCQFLRPLQFPDVIDAGLRIARLGNSSVRYEVGIFKQGDDEPAAVGYFVHVFVERATNRPKYIEGQLRSAMQALLIES